MKVIYLDQNGWINLAKGWYNKDAEIYSFVENLKKKINNKELIIVLSLINLEETLKIRDKQRREKLLDFMINLSDGYCIYPFIESITKTEIANLFFSRFKVCTPINIRDVIVGRGITYIMGASPTFKSKEPLNEELKEKIKKELSSPNLIQRIFSLPETVNRAQKFTANNRLLAERLNEIRKKEREIKDIDLRNRVIIARHLYHEIFPKISRFQIEDLGLFEKEFLLKKGSTKEDLIKLFQELPANYCYFTLTDRGYRELDRPINDHDINDIFSLSVAIPYCDIVYCDNRFLSIAKQAKLDKLYKTNLVSNIKDLTKVLTSQFPRSS